MNKALVSTILIAGFLFHVRTSKAQEIEQISIDINQSEVHWKGTKMRGMGKHEGIVEIKSGYFDTKGGRLYGGEIILDMNTIMVTDIPEHEPVPRRRLNNHLKSDDFFGVEEYPEAEFLITKIIKQNNQTATAEGELTIRDVTRKITVSLEVTKKNSQITSISSRFRFDRFNWNIGYTGSWADRTFVDKEIEMRIMLKAEI
ncbi:MAG: YceI family protein [Balneola sp.]